MTTITTLPNGDVQVDQEYFDGEDAATLSRVFTARGAYVFQFHANDTPTQICEGLLSTGPTLMIHTGGLEAAIRRTLAG